MGVIAKQSIRGTIATYIGIAVGFVTTFFIQMRYLAPEEIGLARVLIDASSLFVGLASLGTSTSIIRFFPYFNDKSNRGHHGFFFWTIVVPFVGFILFSAIYWACHVPLSNWFGEKSPLFVDYYYMVLPMAFFLLYQTIFETNANVLMHIVVPRTVRELVLRIGWLVIYLLYAFRILSMDGFVIALCLNYGIASIINLCYLISLGHISLRPDWEFLRTNRRLIRDYSLYTGFLIISAVTSVLAPTLSSFFVTSKLGLNFTGVYAIATNIAVMVSIPYRSVTAIASPQLSRAIKENNHEETSHLMHQVGNNLLLIGGFILLVIWINIDLIYSILPNSEVYIAAKNVVLILGLSNLVLAVFNFSQMALSYSRFFAFTLLYSFVLTALSIVLNRWLVPIYGMDGAALSNLISYAFYYMLIIITVRLTGQLSVLNRRILYSAALIAALLALNYLWQIYLPISNLWISSITRSTVLLGGGFAIAYYAQLSPELHALLSKIRIPRQ